MRFLGEAPSDLWGTMLWNEKWGVGSVDMIQAVGKLISDTETLTDTVSQHVVTKLISDTEVLTDSIAQKVITKLLSDTETLTDSVYKSYLKVITDSLASSTGDRFDVIKVLPDTVTITDGVLHSYSKLISNTQTLSIDIGLSLIDSNGYQHDLPPDTQWGTSTTTTTWTRETPGSTTWV